MVKSLFPIKGLEASLSKIVMKSAPVQKKKRHPVINHNNANTMSKTSFLNPLPSLRNPKQVLNES